MKNGGFIIELEFCSSGMRGYYSENIFGTYYALCPDKASIFSSKRLAKFYVINLVRKYPDIKMFSFKRVKY